MSRRHALPADAWGLRTEEEIRAYCKQRRYSVAYASYWAEHPYDEALLAYGIVEPSGPPHHIVTRGAGGGDDARNLVALSRENHVLVHKVGIQGFLGRFPHLTEKFKGAYETEQNHASDLDS